jgi:hypothetical protein
MHINDEQSLDMKLNCNSLACVLALEEALRSLAVTLTPHLSNFVMAKRPNGAQDGYQAWSSLLVKEEGAQGVMGFRSRIACFVRITRLCTASK